MRWARLAGGACLWIAAAQPGFAAAGNIAPGPVSPRQAPTPASPMAAPSPVDRAMARDPGTRWIENLAGRRLFTVDGSALAIFLTEGGWIRETTVPGAPLQRSYFTFLNSRQGTVSDTPNGRAVGFFRLTNSGLAVNYADERSEIWISTSDGIALTESSPAQTSLCMAWYPQGHGFSAADRQAAVAAYAARIGVSYSAANVAPGCGTAAALQADSVPRANTDANAPFLPAVPVPRKPIGKQAALDGPWLSANPILVRTSDVHPVDDPATLAPDSGKAIVSRTTLNAASQTTPSDCLSVEANGANWGFRNRCTYAVKYAYCVNDIADSENSCSVGAISGTVPPNAFGALFVATNLKDTQHDFRWIGCNDETGQVMARLLRSDPPAGQCLRLRNS